MPVFFSTHQPVWSCVNWKFLIILKPVSNDGSHIVSGESCVITLLHFSGWVTSYMMSVSLGQERVNMPLELLFLQCMWQFMVVTSLLVQCSTKLATCSCETSYLFIIFKNIYSSVSSGKVFPLICNKTGFLRSFLFSLSMKLDVIL